ncbi:hypothetical protein ACFQVD_00860 [Streptosporangium amethystogenes subsp. fukuiense]|uniref:Uncharacterized protein n=1 Tax=Streptosporangium amethystogenes subsp. fukuiense TaxID=698418 RepID=A0ABW2SRN3_9ACTN
MRLSEQGWVIWINGDRGPWYARRDKPTSFTGRQLAQGLAVTLVEDDLDAIREKIAAQKALEVELGLNVSAAR